MYRITVIEEEMTPLAASAHQSSLLPAVLVLVAFSCTLLLFAAWAYMRERRRLLCALAHFENRRQPAGLSLRSMREEIAKRGALGVEDALGFLEE